MMPLSFSSKGSNDLASGWSAIEAGDKPLPHGEREFDITLQRGDLQATKSYIIYPDSTVIREWMTFANVGTRSMLELTNHPFCWHGCGGENYWMRWIFIG